MNKQDITYYEQVLNDVAKIVHPRLIVYIGKVTKFDNDLSIIKICISFKNSKRFMQVALDPNDIYDEVKLEVIIDDVFQKLIRRNRNEK